MQNAVANRNNTGFPVTVYDVYPKQEGYQGMAFTSNGDGYYRRAELHSTSGYMQPYTSDRWRETAAKLKVLIPFQTIISRDMGTGRCMECGQKYAGSSPEGCQRVLRKMDMSQSSYNETYKPFEGHNALRKTKVEVCQGRVDWNLQAEFDTQSAFFGLINELAGMYLDDQLTKFESAFPAELIPVLRLKMLENKVMHFEARCTQAFMQISSKMSQAGQALQF